MVAVAVVAVEVEAVACGSLRLFAAAGHRP